MVRAQSLRRLRSLMEAQAQVRTRHCDNEYSKRKAEKAEEAAERARQMAELTQIELENAKQRMMQIVDEIKDRVTVMVVTNSEELEAAASLVSTWGFTGRLQVSPKLKHNEARALIDYGRRLGVIVRLP